MLKSGLCDSNDSYIPVKVTISVFLEQEQPNKKESR